MEVIGPGVTVSEGRGYCNGGFVKPNIGCRVRSLAGATPVRPLAAESNIGRVCRNRRSKWQARASSEDSLHLPAAGQRVQDSPRTRKKMPSLAEGHFVAGIEGEILRDVVIRERSLESAVAARHRRILIQHGLRKRIGSQERKSGGITLLDLGLKRVIAAGHVLRKILNRAEQRVRSPVLDRPRSGGRIVCVVSTIQVRSLVP